MPYTFTRNDDILYVRLVGATIYASYPLKDDGFVILNQNRAGGVVGLQLLGVGEMSSARWRSYFQTPEIPNPLFQGVLAFLQGSEDGKKEAMKKEKKSWVRPKGCACDAKLAAQFKCSAKWMRCHARIAYTVARDKK